MSSRLGLIQPLNFLNLPEIVLEDIQKTTILPCRCHKINCFSTGIQELMGYQANFYRVSQKMSISKKGAKLSIKWTFFGTPGTFQGRLVLD